MWNKKISQIRQIKRKMRSINFYVYDMGQMIHKKINQLAKFSL